MAYQILVVDDEPALRMMVQEILTQAGYAVCLAGSCRESGPRSIPTPFSWT